jgi:hypothetical protein
MHRNSDRQKANKIKTILLLNTEYNPEEIVEIFLLDDSKIRREY